MRTRTEHGYPGHFVCAEKCRYRRLTVIHEDGRPKYLVSTVGAFTPSGETEYNTIGVNRYYETYVFHAKAETYWGDTCYEIGDDPASDGEEMLSSCTEIDADGINEPYAFAKADAMHERMVEKWMKGEPS